MKLLFTKQALKATQKLDAKQYKQVCSSILALCSNPEPHDSQILKGATQGEHRLDIGEYRVIYALLPEALEILVVGKRNDDDVYKIWQRT